MSNAKNYPNTIELVAEQIYNAILEYKMKELENIGEFDHKQMIYKSSYSQRPTDEKAYFKHIAGACLNSIYYFEGKTCKDCGHFDPETKSCFGEDREHEGCAESPICETFAPKGLVEGD